MKLTKNFDLIEMTRTIVGLPNTPEPHEVDKLFYVCAYILQPIRDKWGVIVVGSGYRSFYVNEKLGGSISSQHLKGEAADFQTQADLKKVYNWIMESDIKYGQLIYEKQGKTEWIHISLPRKDRPNNQNLSHINGVREVITAPLEI